MTIRLSLTEVPPDEKGNADAELPFFGYLVAEDPVRYHLRVSTEAGSQRIPLWAERNLSAKLVFKRLLHAITTPFHERPYDTRMGGTFDPLFAASIRLATVLGNDNATLAAFDPAQFVDDNLIITDA